MGGTTQDVRLDPKVQELLQKLDCETPGKVVGIVGIQAFKGDQLVWERKDYNLISYDIRDVLGELLIQQSLLPGARTTADLRVNSIQMGTSNASTDRSHTGLQSAPAVTKTLTAPDVAKVSPGVYTFTTTMLTSEGNGNTFTEVGLFTVDGTMLSRQVHSPFDKDVTLTVQYTWTYVFS